MEDIHQKVEKGRWKRIYSNSLDSAVHSVMLQPFCNKNVFFLPTRTGLFLVAGPWLLLRRAHALGFDEGHAVGPHVRV